MRSSASLRCVRHRKVPELYVGREAPELKRVEGRSVTVKRETTRPMLKLAGSDQNPPLQRQRRKWGYFNGDMHDVSLEQTVVLTKLMSRIIDFRSSFTAMHSAGVAASAKALAKLAGMSEADCMKMEIAGNLHDVGKLRVPNEILEKPGKLTDEEFNKIKEHPYYTRLILMDVEGFDEIADWAGFHHEKLNGNGYPFHFDGSLLSLGSRIMAVADIFSAITEERPYRKPMSREQAMKVMWENVERGDICGNIVKLLEDNYDTVNAARMKKSLEAGERYFATHKMA